MLGDKVISKIIKLTIAISIVIVGLLAIFIKDAKNYILGMIFGSSISVLSFILMGITTKRAVHMDSSRAYGYTVRNYFLRYLIYFIVLFVAAVADYLNLFTTILGLFMIKIVILSGAIYDNIKECFKRKAN
ncbi:ATP synthase subunit I [Anaerosalibacter sp. Marseille-P3206]|uniref:ATP synthase subunit I n=1 Tax=Anaerosalibacter sp. Marseille-P3206 TaxID=1871005 RepID=UPI000985A13E|nr:ATP synthase subunit I [Anaerosalibacter sp. Marseille-P3206]